MKIVPFVGGRETVLDRWNDLDADWQGVAIGAAIVVLVRFFDVGFP